MKEFLAAMVVIATIALAFKSCSDASAACTAQIGKCWVNGNCVLCTKER